MDLNIFGKKKDEAFADYDVLIEQTKRAIARAEFGSQERKNLVEELKSLEELKSKPEKTVLEFAKVIFPVFVSTFGCLKGLAIVTEFVQHDILPRDSMGILVDMFKGLVKIGDKKL